MQNFIEYPYTISINKLEKTVKDVMQAGYNVIVIINGEYYNISADEEKNGEYYDISADGEEKPGKTGK